MFSVATFKPLGTLSYHRDTVHALAFANPPVPVEDDGESVAETLELGAEDSVEDDEGELDEVPPTERWMASGGKDRRVALWGLMEFAHAGPGG